MGQRVDLVPSALPDGTGAFVQVPTFMPGYLTEDGSHKGIEFAWWYSLSGFRRGMTLSERASNAVTALPSACLQLWPCA